MTSARMPRRAQARVHGVEERLLVLLEVPVVGEGQPLEDGQQRDQVAGHPAHPAPGQLEHVGILLLRHQRGTGGVGVGQLGETELRGGPEHDLLGQPGEMDHEQRAGRDQLHGEVAVGDGIQAVGAERREVERAPGAGAVDGQRGAGQRPAAERQHVAAAVAVAQPFGVALEHLDVGQQVVGERDDLGPLGVGVAGERGGPVLAGTSEQRFLQPRAAEHQVDGAAPAPEAQVGGHLVVATAPGVQPPGDRPDQLVEAALHGGVDVLVGRVDGEVAPLQLATDGAQAGEDGAEVTGPDQADLAEHPGVGDRPLDVLGVEPEVEPRLLVYSSTPRAVRVPSRPSQTLAGACRAGSRSLRLPRAISAA